MVQDIAARCPSFRFSKDEVRNVLKDVAEYKAPGVYVLSEYTKKHELTAVEQKFGRAGAAGKMLTASQLHQRESLLRDVCEDEFILKSSYLIRDCHFTERSPPSVAQDKPKSWSNSQLSELCMMCRLGLAGVRCCRTVRALAGQSWAGS